MLGGTKQTPEETTCCRCKNGGKMRVIQPISPGYLHCHWLEACSTDYECLKQNDALLIEFTLFFFAFKTVLNWHVVIVAAVVVVVLIKLYSIFLITCFKRTQHVLQHVKKIPRAAEICWFETFKIPFAVKTINSNSAPLESLNNGSGQVQFLNYTK